MLLCPLLRGFILIVFLLFASWFAFPPQKVLCEVTCSFFLSLCLFYSRFGFSFVGFLGFCLFAIFVPHFVLSLFSLFYVLGPLVGEKGPCKLTPFSGSIYASIRLNFYTGQMFMLLDFCVQNGDWC